MPIHNPIKITKTNRKDYDQYLMGQITIKELVKKRKLKLSRIRKMFEILFAEEKIKSVICKKNAE